MKYRKDFLEIFIFKCLVYEISLEGLFKWPLKHLNMLHTSFTTSPYNPFHEETFSSYPNFLHN